MMIKSHSSNNPDSMASHFYLPFSASSEPGLPIFPCAFSNTKQFSSDLIIGLSLRGLERDPFIIHRGRPPGMSLHMKLLSNRLCSGEAIWMGWCFPQFPRLAYLHQTQTVCFALLLMLVQIRSDPASVVPYQPHILLTLFLFSKLDFCILSLGSQKLT